MVPKEYRLRDEEQIKQYIIGYHQHSWLRMPQNLIHSSVMLSRLGCQISEDHAFLGDPLQSFPVESCIFLLVSVLSHDKPPLLYSTYVFEFLIADTICGFSLLFRESCLHLDLFELLLFLKIQHIWIMPSSSSSLLNCLFLASPIEELMLMSRAGEGECLGESL